MANLFDENLEEDSPTEEYDSSSFEINNTNYKKRSLLYEWNENKIVKTPLLLDNRIHISAFEVDFISI